MKPTAEQIDDVVAHHIQYNENFSIVIERSWEDLLYDRECNLGIFLSRFQDKNRIPEFTTCQQLHREYHYMCAVCSTSLKLIGAVPQDFSQHRNAVSYSLVASLQRLKIAFGYE